MIEFSEVHNFNAIEKIKSKLENKNVSYNSDSLAIFNLKSDEVILAFVAVDIDSIYLRILYLELLGSAVDTEFLFKSISVYAQNNNRFTLKSEENSIKSVMETLPNYVINSAMYIDTLKLCCGSCNI